VEASISEQLVGPENRQRDIRNLLLLATVFPSPEQEISVYWFDRNDDFREPNGDARDFSPSYLGLHAHGERRYWHYWLEAARARGRIEGVPLRGHAVDVGVSVFAPVWWKPTLTLGYAMASGDEDPFDGIQRTFRQTGLQLNKGKWNGVTNFRYYGELLRPELANLHIETYGFGFRPKRHTSIDLIYHRYRLDEPAASMVSDGIEDRRLNLVDTEIGQEIDLVLGFEELQHWEFELDLGVFDPGEAFIGDTDVAVTARFKAKFVF